MNENIEIRDGKKQINRELLISNLGKNHNLIINLKDGKRLEGWLGREDDYFFIGGVNFSLSDIVDVKIIY